MISHFRARARIKSHSAAGPRARWRGASDDLYPGLYVRSEQQSLQDCGPQPLASARPALVPERELVPARAPTSISDQEYSIVSAFDAVAPDYDAIWTDSIVGRLQRQQIWRALQPIFHPGDRILELGCGTGADAVHLAGAGVRVHATDASREMLRAAEVRIERERLSGMVTLEQRSVEQLWDIRDRTPFDGALSNFGVFNCVRDLSCAASNLARLLRPGARLVLCFMGRFCAWETAWYLLRGRPRKAFRRLLAGNSGVETALKSGLRFRVYYPSVADFVRAFQADFNLVSFRSIGLFIPPSCMEPWASGNRSVLDKMALLDGGLGGWPVLRGMGDHRLAIFVRKAEITES